MNAMTLTEAKTAPQVSDDDVRLAETEADEAQHAAETLERAAVEGEAGAAKPAAVLEARALAEFARKRASRLRQQAAAARAAARLLALDAVGTDVTAVAQAAADNGPIAAQIKKIADARIELDRLCADHDSAVRALMDRAARLGAEPAGPTGPLATSAHIAPIRGGVQGTTGLQAGSQLVRVTGKRAAEAAILAAQGEPDKAIAHLDAVRQQREHQRAAHYYRSPNGRIVTADDPIPSGIADQLRKKDLKELTDSEIDVYLDGRLDGHRTPTA